jgi:hypothetical protein
MYNDAQQKKMSQITGYIRNLYTTQNYPDLDASFNIDDSSISDSQTNISLRTSHKDPLHKILNTEGNQLTTPNHNTQYTGDYIPTYLTEATTSSALSLKIPANRYPNPKNDFFLNVNCRSLVKSNLVNYLTDNKLEMIFMWIKRLGRVTRDEFLNKITDIIGDQSPEATEIINNVFELVDFEDTGYISKGEFFDF